MDTFYLRLAGEIDLGRQDELDALVRAFDRSPESSVCVDLSRVTFMDSTGLGMLLRLRDIAGERGGTVTLTHVRPPVTRLLTASKLEALFDGGHAVRRPVMIR